MASIYDNYPSTLNPLQLQSISALLQNQGLRVSPNITTAISSYNGKSLISTCITMKVNAAAGTGGINTTNKQAVANIACTTVPALGDSIPQYYLGLGTFANVTYPFPGMVGIVQTKANIYLGSPTGYATDWNMGRFAQIFAACDSYAQLANQVIISSCNSDDYLCDTFSNNNNMVTGDITKITLATGQFGTDLANLGQLIDLTKLEDLGSPVALMQQIVNIVGVVPVISLTFLAAGVPEDAVVNLDNPNYTFADSVQKAMYQGMTQVTGDALTQILQILEVTTTGITTMADLLNPYKLFPNSFQTLTVPTKNGSRGIYTNAQGDVNTTLIQGLPAYVINSAVANGNTAPYAGTLPTDYNGVVI
jgi:hypothetical protein